MSEEKHHHHSLHERLEAARTAADEVVADEAGQLASETDGVFVPFEEAAAAIRAALHPDRVDGDDAAGGSAADDGAEGESTEETPPAG